MSYGKEYNSIQFKVDWDYDALAEGVVEADKKIKVLLHYSVNGDIKEAADYGDVDYRTVVRWKKTASWWDQELTKIRRAKTDEIDAQFSKIIEEANTQILDRVQNGDEKLDKNGLPVRVKMGGRDLVLVAAVAFDKLRLIRGEATSISTKASTIEDLMVQFEKMSNQNLPKSKKQSEDSN